MIPFYIYGTSLVTLFAIGIIVSVVIQKRHQVRVRLEKQRLAFDYEQALLRSKLEVQEATLSTLSRELHDGINSTLLAIVFQMRLAKSYMEDGKGKQVLDTATTKLVETAEQLRSLSHNLNTGIVTESSLGEAIQREVERVNSFSDINCALLNEAANEPGPDARLLSFRIIQEAIQNALKYSLAKNISILCKNESDHYIIGITDDGVGYDANAPRTKTSLGLKSMIERAALMQSTIDIKSGINLGTSITLKIPLKSHSHE